MTAVGPTLQSWFTDRLGRQRHASPCTVASYRDTLRLLLRFMQESTGKEPSSLDWDDLDDKAISEFLDHLESERNNGARTRNLRLTAIRSLFRYAALRTRSTRRDPAGAGHTHQALRQGDRELPQRRRGRRAD